ncbi:rRNA maturation RNase YbeY [Halodurantibacterium flavum]|uniref:Endoribonuclease YbeY n=1 Tax=Halodurantibacterium flavum TaxID=1382802 RepID=A0ABW4S6V3_9RHOB
MTHHLVDTLIEDSRWEEFGLAPLAERAARAALGHLALDPAGYEISLLACDDRRIAELNGDFRDKPLPTNVLSWPSEERGAAPGAHPDLPEGDPDMPEELGNIAIAWETCAREAVEQDKPMADHVTHLLVHGVLHLFGYDHILDSDAELMERLEVEILAGLGVADPYGEATAGMTRTDQVNTERNDGRIG